ncbi:MAG: TonB-dependent receptor, partial [Candidatus Stahlbacteria bacterium]|nr:TonB-dependent receptor [Candidatus Stahlbacteria bacterium]
MFSLMLIWGLMTMDTLASIDSLQYPIYEMDEIVVTATRTPRLQKEISLPITVITEEEIKGINLKDIGDIIGYGLSAKIEKYGGMGAVSSIFMRGLYSAHTMVLIDGRPVNSPSLGGADLSWISGVGIERIEIVRGPISSLYGANALAGVVNIITHSKPKNNVSLSYGNWNTFISSMESGKSFGNLTSIVTGAYRKSDGERDNSAHNSKELSGKVKYKLGVWNFNLHTGFYQGETGMPGVKPASDTMERNLSQKRLGNNEVSSLYDNSKDNRFFSTAGVNFHNLKLSGFLNNWEDDAHREWIDLNWVTFQEERHNANDNHKTKSYGIELVDTRKLWNNLITYGASFNKDIFEATSIDSNLTTDSCLRTPWDADRETKAIYLQDEIEIRKVRATLGIRWDSTSYDTSGFAQISPKTSIAWKFIEGSKLIASYGKGFRTPSLNDLYWPSDPFAEGNPNLKPEKSESYEVGIDRVFFKKIFAGISL